MSYKKIKKIGLLTLIPMMAFVLSGCSTSAISEKSTGIWDHGIIYNFSKIIIWLSDILGHNYGWGIVAFTIIVRVFILPLSHLSMKTMREQQELAPEIKKLKEKYPGKDVESQRQLQEETQAIYAEAGINPLAGCFPLLVQFPVLIALYQAISRTPILKDGTFFGLRLGTPDPTYILPILAAVFTFLTSYLSMMAQPEQNGMTKTMTFVMPAIIFFTAINMPVAISVYWVTTNAFSALQTLVLQNPFKIRRQRDQKARMEKQKMKEIKKAKRKALKK